MIHAFFLRALLCTCPLWLGACDKVPTEASYCKASTQSPPAALPEGHAQLFAHNPVQSGEQVTERAASTQAPLWSRTWYADAALEQGPLGAGWRHPYQSRLYREGDRLLLVRANGQALRFDARSGLALAPSGSAMHAHSPPGDWLQQQGPDIHWQRADGSVMSFRGSWPIALKHTDGTVVQLRYATGRLHRLISSDGRSVELYYRKDRIYRLGFEDGTGVTYHYNADGQLESVERDGRQVTSVYPSVKDSGPSNCPPGTHFVPGSVTLDAAPAAGPQGPAGVPIEAGATGTPFEPITDIYNSGPDVDGTSPGTVTLDPSAPDDVSGSNDNTHTDNTESGTDTTPEEPDESEEATTCDTRQQPPPEDFVTRPGVPDAQRIDARPASCASYFVDYQGIERGQQIEAGLAGLIEYSDAQPTVPSFPVVDFVREGESVIVISRDLTAVSYSAGQALYDRLMRDGQAVEERLLEPLRTEGVVSVTERGETTQITAETLGTPVLELVIRYGSATPSHMQQIIAAAEQLLILHGVVLRVIEIP